eukprot:Em0096g9a
MDERGGVVPVNSDKKASKRRFLLFRRRRKRPSDDSLPYESDTPKVTNSMIESETSEMDITGLSMCPSEALQINGDASNAPPAVPKGDAEKLSIQAAETTDMNKVTARSPALTEALSCEEQEYIVQVTLDSGHNLAIRDKSGSSDPYVKFKHKHFKYRSAFLNQNLNPQWNEIVSFKTTDLSSPLQMQVFDHDYGSADDFMGAASLNLDKFADGQVHMRDVGLSDPSCPHENLGYIRLFIKIDCNDSKLTTKTDKNSIIQQDGKKMAKSILTVTLLNGEDLPSMDDNGLSDPYCKFRLGSQRYKSKVKFKTLNPQWKEKFDFRVFEGDDTLNIEVWDRDFPSADDYMGVCNVELGTLVPDKTYDLTLPLVDSGCGSIHLLLCLSGMAVNKMDECDGPQNDEESYVSGDVRLVEFIETEIYQRCRTAEIGGIVRLNIGVNANLFATLEVGNSQMRTDVVYKCASPMWNRTFCFNVKDIHDDLEVTVYNERKTGKNEFVGKLVIPLLRLRCGTAKMYALKDKHCNMKAKAGGVVMLECDLVYNHVLMSNIRRATYLGRTLLSTWHFIQSLWSWEDKWLSAISFFLFVVACLLAEVWMVFPLLILLLLYGYMVVYMRGHHLWQIDSRRKSRHRDGDDEEESSMEELEGSELEDEGDPAAEDQSKAGISQKFKQLQRVLLLLQTLLGQLADLGERIHNFCHWRVPWLCWLAITVLTVAMVIVYFIPLRYIILAWGVNKFTKRLRNPHYIDNQELLDFISRAPTYKQLHKWNEVSVQVESKRLKVQMSSSDNECFVSKQATTGPSK